MKYQSRQDVISAAQALGSTATTYAGAVRYILKVARNTTPLEQRGEKIKILEGAANYWRWGHPMPAPNFFSRPDRTMSALPGFLRQAEEAKAEGICRVEGLWTRDDALETLRVVEAPLRRAVPLGSASSSEVAEYARRLYPARKNWLTPEPRTRHDVLGVVDIDNGRYSSRCTYTHWTYKPVVTSYGIVLNAGAVLRWYWATDAPVDLAVPHGYRWDRDGHGIRIVSLTDPRKDYHPDSDDLRHYSAAAIRRQALQNFKKRQEVARQKREDEASIRRAEAEGCMVCVADSVRAGNCKAGTISWAKQHRLDPDRHYRPSELLAIMNGTAHKVRLVVTVALRRHRQEMSRGYALIADHAC